MDARGNGLPSLKERVQIYREAFDKLAALTGHAVDRDSIAMLELESKFEAILAMSDWDVPDLDRGHKVPEYMEEAEYMRDRFNEIADSHVERHEPRMDEHVPEAPLLDERTVPESPRSESDWSDMSEEELDADYQYGGGDQKTFFTPLNVGMTFCVFAMSVFGSIS